ncbi:hypothetical protein ACLOJK_030528 [Asimina triloba]
MESFKEFARPVDLSTNLDSWGPEQLRMMILGGNNRAQVFFKQHGWSDGGKIEAKYTSRAAELYRQLLSKEVVKCMSEGSPPSPVASRTTPRAHGLSDVKTKDAFKENSTGKPETPETVPSPKAPIQSVVINAVKKPAGARKVGGRTGGLGARRLTTKPNESLYDQMPEEPAPVVTSSTNAASTLNSSAFPSRFENVDNIPSTGTSPRSGQVVDYFALTKSPTFPSDYGLDGGYQKKRGSSPVKVQETTEARQKFANAKSISSAQFFGDQNKTQEMQAQASLKKFSSSASISSADLFGNDNNGGLDLTANDLINRISFQVCVISCVASFNQLGIH